jgi:hypothetical protein
VLLLSSEVNQGVVTNMFQQVCATLSVRHTRCTQISHMMSESKGRQEPTGPKEKQQLETKATDSCEGKLAIQSCERVSSDGKHSMTPAGMHDPTLMGDLCWMQPLPCCSLATCKTEGPTPAYRQAALHQSHQVYKARYLQCCTLTTYKALEKKVLLIWTFVKAMHERVGGNYQPRS